LHTGRNENRAGLVIAKETEPRPLDLAWQRERMERLKEEFRRYGKDVAFQRIPANSITWPEIFKSDPSGLAHNCGLPLRTSGQTNACLGSWNRYYVKY
jgi:hypothetical protein